MIRTTFHREFPQILTVKGIVVKKTPAGKWFACLQFEEKQRIEFTDKSDPAARVMATLSSGGSAVGIDLGITHFAVDSDGRFAANPMHLDRSLTKVKMLERNLSRKKKGSRWRAKAKHALVKLHERVVNQRRDYLHKLSRYYVGRYDIICAENLTVVGMLDEKSAASGKGRKRTLHRHIADAGWGMFLDMLAYKAQSAGKLALFVDPRGTSQECAVCGATVPKELRERVHSCARCGFTTDRDINASLVIRKRGTGRAPSPVELTPLVWFTGASAGEEAGTLINSRYIVLT